MLSTAVLANPVDAGRGGAAILIPLRFATFIASLNRNVSGVSKNLRITDAGVFGPLESDPLFALVGTFPFPSSDHRLVWVDVHV